ncbi:phage holin family protein [Leifsonia sp. fls2-241-R2A-40a]|uniref:phage holin family protein n=1 Tax=Leifsonia sp. fls2-241-R2A-40a TaxID=3040290 RepID=UPI00254AF1F3|nr:phage holin family protein [Leifsonia sp. fls2-241-R2A-40a]
MTDQPSAARRVAAEAAAPDAAEERAANSSLGELLGEVSRDLSTLIRQEMELAKAEIKQTVTRAGKGAGLLGGAGYAGLMAVFFLSVALWWALGYLVGNAWSAVIVAIIWGIVALILYTRGRKQLKTVEGAPQTVETVKEIPETLKPNGENR